MWLQRDKLMTLDRNCGWQSRVCSGSAKLLSFDELRLAKLRLLRFCETCVACCIAVGKVMFASVSRDAAGVMRQEAVGIRCVAQPQHLKSCVGLGTCIGLAKCT